MRIMAVQFDDDGGVQITWLEEREQRKEGGVFHTTFLSMEAQDASENVGYYMKELKQDAEELLAHWHRYLRDN